MECQQDDESFDNSDDNRDSEHEINDVRLCSDTKINELQPNHHWPSSDTRLQTNLGLSGQHYLDVITAKETYQEVCHLQ